MFTTFVCTWFNLNTAGFTDFISFSSGNSGCLGSVESGELLIDGLKSLGSGGIFASRLSFETFRTGSLGFLLEFCLLLNPCPIGCLPLNG